MEHSEHSVHRELPVNSEYLIRAVDLSKSFGNQRVLTKLSLHLQGGDTALLLGQNGAGKSTLLRILAGLSRADSGDLTRDVGTRVDFVGNGLQLYPRLTVAENLRLFAALAASPRGHCKEPSFCKEMEEWGIERFANRAVSSLSRGNQWRVALARVFLQPPRVLLLDEPTSNLDDSSVEVLLRKISELVERCNGAVLIASHDVARLHAAANRAFSISSGQISADTGPMAGRESMQLHIEAYRTRNR
jgi:ABC-type multidrug transport system ATPase subunit